MALTPLQRKVCRLLANRRRTTGDSYIAGGVALSVALDSLRLSRDLDVFHDTTEAVSQSWDADRQTLEAAGYAVAPLRERPGFVEATVRLESDILVVEWARDSAFRFFPLVEHEELGLTLHPFDLATNKVLALVGRVEARDWVDVLACDERVQPLGYLAWAACGKDPGFSPASIIEIAVRSARYSGEEIAALDFNGVPPDAAQLSRRWRSAIESAHRIIERLPVAHVGEAVLADDGRLLTAGYSDLGYALDDGRVRFHQGHIGGALPQFRGPTGSR